MKTAVFYGGIPVETHKELLKNDPPHVVIGTPGRVLQLAEEKALNLKNIKYFILDECDKMLESLEMRNDIQKLFRMTPHEKQVTMFSATLSDQVRPICKKFMHNVIIFFIITIILFWPVVIDTEHVLLKKQQCRLFNRISPPKHPRHTFPNTDIQLLLSS